MDKININRCSYEDSLTLPVVGDKIATQIWRMGQDWGALKLADLTQLLQFLNLI
jgi:DNA uptake protein ComE-like DNA-binding protein